MEWTQERRERLEIVATWLLRNDDHSSWKDVLAALSEIDRLTARVEGLGPTREELFYLGKARARMIELRDCAVDEENALSLGNAALADEIDWLDCFIDKRERALTPPREEPA